VAKNACWSCSGGGSSLKVNYDDRDFFAVTGEDPDQSSKISLAISSLKSTGIFDLSSRNLNFGVLFNYGEVIYYYTSVKSIGKVTITKLDLANKIISGTFDFTAEDENNPANTIKVTDGRFDVKYN